MTIVETMLYKESLCRLEHSLNEAEKRRTAEFKKNKKIKPIEQRVSQSENQADSESDDEEEEQQLMIDWALEWWRKPGAS